MTTTTIFDGGVGDQDWGNGGLFARAVAIDSAKPMLMISRTNYGNDSTSSFNIQNMDEVGVIRQALDAIEHHFKQSSKE